MDIAGNVTTYDYDASTGQLKSTTNAVGKVQYFDYTARGELYRAWGDTPYPVEYEHDDFGRRTVMRTWRAGDDWDEPTWPESPPEAEVTRWLYEPATGLLLKKLYHDATEQNPSIAYTYTTDGKLKTRAWKRTVGGNPLVTTYDYFGDQQGEARTGELQSVTYSDDTPDVSFTYDRLGRKATVTDVVGTRTFSYNEHLQLSTESIDGTGDFYDKLITRKYEGSGQGLVPGRDAGFDVGVTGDPDQDYDADYHYDAYGRLERVEGPGLPGYGGKYAYVSNSDLLDKLDFMSDSSTTLARVDYTHEPNRDLVTAVENVVDPEGTPTTISKYDYGQGSGYDALGRRTSVVMTGSAFGNGHHNDYGYNDRSELTAADRKTGTTPGQGTVMTPGDWDYVYDHIGNRASHGLDGTSRYYCANNLNQYTFIDDAANTCPTPPAPGPAPKGRPRPATGAARRCA